MAGKAQGLTPQPIAAELAALALAGCERLDPTGMTDAAGILAMCQGGACFALGDGERVGLVYVLRAQNRVLWVDAARGTGPVNLTAELDLALAEQARRHGMRAVAFQTARPGLVRKMRSRGYKVAGWIMSKELDQ